MRPEFRLAKDGNDDWLNTGILVLISMYSLVKRWNIRSVGCLYVNDGRKHTSRCGIFDMYKVFKYVCLIKKDL